MMADLDEQTRRMVEVAVAAAPAFTTEQINELRRVLKPGERIPAVTLVGRELTAEENAFVANLPARPAKPARRAA